MVFYGYVKSYELQILCKTSLSIHNVSDGQLYRTKVVLLNGIHCSDFGFLHVLKVGSYNFVVVT
jgi:hypothetical protein